MNFSPVNIEARKNLDMRAGDTVRVTQKIEDKGKTRLQVFEGMMLYRKHGTEAGATFTIRKTASGIGVERTFPLFSPMIETLEVTKRSKTRRSKLYYVRHKAAKEISKRMKMVMMTLGLKDEETKVDEANAEAEAAAAPVVEAPVTETAEEVVVEEAPQEAEVVEEVVEEAPVVEEKKEEVVEEAPEESKSEDLTKIEGIGPKIAEVLAGNGISTFAQLADAKDEDTQKMIKDVAGNHQAGTWNEQASLARDGKWDELKELQDKLDGGVEK